MAQEAANAAFYVLNRDRQTDRRSIPGIEPFIEDLEREIDGVDIILIPEPVCSCATKPSRPPRFNCA